MEIIMHWTDMNEDLRILYNAIATAHADTVSKFTAQRAEEEAMTLMEKLTIKLNSLHEN
jgi:hypothetical protein